MDDDDRAFYRRHVFLKESTLHWLADRDAVDPEDAIIAALDGESLPDESLPATPSLDGIDEDLVWIWRCRDRGMGWKEIAPLVGLRTAAGAWKRFHRLLREARKKLDVSIGEERTRDAQDAC